MLQANQTTSDTRRVPVLARTLFRHMQDQGYTREQIIGVSTELLGLVSTDIQGKQELLPAE